MYNNIISEIEEEKFLDPMCIESPIKFEEEILHFERD